MRSPDPDFLSESNFNVFQKVSDSKPIRHDKMSTMPRPPYERPATAPRITEPAPIERSLALYSVSAPIPASLKKFLDDQGGWYNPFLHPGMTGPYDLRS